MAAYRSLVPGFIATLGLVTLTTSVYAAEIYSTFGPGDSYNLALNFPVYGPSTGLSTDSQSVAGFFTPTQNYNLTSFDVGVRYLLGTNSFVFSIVADNGGLPTGAAVVSPFSTPLTGTLTVPAIDSFAVTGSLLAGQKYWLVMEPGTPDSLAWWGASTNGALGAAIKFNGGSWVNQAGLLPAPVFRINGNLTAAALTPEVPAGVQAVPVLLALGSMALYQRRKKKASATSL